MMEGYKQVWVKVSTYRKLKELSEKHGKKLSKIIDELVNGVSESIGESTTFDENTIRKIVREEISKAFKDLEPMLYNIVKKAISELSTKKKFIEVIKEAFLGKREPITLKKAPIEIRKGEIVFKTTERPEIDLSQFKAKLVENTNDEGVVIDYSIVPDIGFEDMSLEEWFDNYGSELLKVFQV